MTERFETWKGLQEREVTSYRAGLQRNGDYRGFFSIAEYGDARRAGNRIAEACTCCLDIGSGVLENPAYMRQELTAFFGIDPFFGEGKRGFPFTQAVGEHLPFPDGYFPCVSFMSTLDHQIEPLDSLKEAWRVLRGSGRLYVWTELRAENDARYRWWKQQPDGTLFDDHHQHAFVLDDLVRLFEQAGFDYVGRESYPGTSYWPPTHLLVGVKA